MIRSLVLPVVVISVLAVFSADALGQADVCNTCGPVAVADYGYAEVAPAAVPMSHWDRCLLGCKRNNVWPQPFVTQDRHAICSMYAVFERSGWSRQSTLSRYHFDPVTNELTEAGRLKLRQILLQHPNGRNDVFMASSANQEIDQIRLASIEHEGARLFPNKRQMPRVTPVHVEYRMRPAEEVDVIIRNRVKLMPASLLPERDSSW